MKTAFERLQDPALVKTRAFALGPGYVDAWHDALHVDLQHVWLSFRNVRNGLALPMVLAATGSEFVKPGWKSSSMWINHHLLGSRLPSDQWEVVAHFVYECARKINVHLSWGGLSDPSFWQLANMADEHIVPEMRL